MTDHRNIEPWGGLPSGARRALLQARAALVGPVADGQSRRCAVATIDQTLAAMEAQAREIEALRAVPSGWQPIETAPKNGTSMLVYCNRMVIEAWYGNAWGKFVNAVLGGTHGLDNPTHWMPLPAAPVPEAGGVG